MSKPFVLNYSAYPQLIKEINQRSVNVDWQKISTPKEIIEIAKDHPSPPRLILFSPADGSTLNQISEALQGLRCFYVDCPLFYVINNREHLYLDTIKKNGSSEEIFVYPDDLEFLLNHFFRLIPESLNLGGKNLTPILVADLSLEQAIPFDIYMGFPKNNRHIRVIKAGQPAPKNLFKKLKEEKIEELYVLNSEFEKFKKYCMGLFDNNYRNDDGITNSRTFLDEEIRRIYFQLFNQERQWSFDDGRQMSSKLVNSIRSLETLIKDTQLERSIAQTLSLTNSHFSHLTCVCLLSFIFGKLLNNGLEEHLALSGILHDLEDFGQYGIANDDENETNKGKRIVTFVRNRKIPIPNSVATIIEEHHKGKSLGNMDTLSEGAQILSFADRLAVEAYKARDKERVNLKILFEETQKHVAIQESLYFRLYNSIF